MIKLWHGASGAFVGTLTDYEDIELTWTLRGPDSGQIAMPVTAIRSQRDIIRSERLGSYVTIEDSSLVEPWFGRVRGAPGSSSSPSGALQLAGPESWLSHQMIPSQQLTGTARGIIMNTLDTFPVDTRLVRGCARVRGPGGYLDTDGMSIWELFDSLEQERGIWVRLSGTPHAMAEWRIEDPATPLDLTGVVLREGTNAEFDFEHDLEPNLGTLLGVADSIGSAGGIQSGGQRAPVQSVIGLKAAYDQTLRSAHGRSGLAKPETSTQVSLAAALEAELRRALPLMQMAQVEVRDESLWASLWPGRLVSARCTSDPMADFDRSVVLIEQATFRITPPKALTLAVALWEVE